jgi:hypothetical protein
MKTSDWLSAVVVAAAVALLVVVAGLPPLGWADDKPLVSIPSLPPAALKIPSLDTTVTAKAERVPGEPVIVTLSCKCTSGYGGQSVPLTVHVFQRNPQAEMSRRASPPSTQDEIATGDCTLAIDSDGNGYASVDLPLNWTPDSPVSKAEPPNPNAPNATNSTAKRVTPAPRYYLVLTSELVKNESAVVPIAAKTSDSLQQQKQQVN